VARLIYSAITSLDGYVADREGNWDWSRPDEEVHRFVNDMERATGTYLLGRRMYEVLSFWESAEFGDDEPVMRDYAEIWRAADKVVYSRTLDDAATARTRLQSEFDPAAVRAMKESAGANISIGGPELAAQALCAGLVDEINLLLSPVVVGGGNPSLPDDLRVDVELLDQRRFGNGAVHLHYRVAPRS